MTDQEDNTSERIARQARRMHQAKQSPVDSPLKGLGAFGMFGWSIAVPTVLGAMLGLWLDRLFAQSISWTIALLLGGLALGIFIAWTWMAKERDR